MINLVATAELILLLQDAPIGAKKLAAKTGMKRETVLRWIKVLSAKGRRLVRTADYDRSFKGAPVPLYQWNPEKLPDVKPPTPKTPLERSRESRQRRKMLKLTNLGV